MAFPAAAQEWSLERLYTRPYIWGAAPQSPTWSKEGHTLVFLWNEEGNRFQDLYAFHPDSGRRVRLTDLESFADDLLKSSAEEDSRRRLYLPPKSGIGDFTVSRDGARVAFSYEGELFTVPTDGSAEPFRLTRSKSGESSPEFSPDGKALASIRGGQLFVQNLDDGRLWQVTDVESPRRLLGCDWAPDGGHFACMVREGPGRQMPLPNYSGRFVTAEPFSRSVAGDTPATYEIFIIPASGGEAVAVDLGAWGGKGSLSGPKWSEDSKSVALVAIDPSWKKLEMRVADAATGESRVVWEETDERWVYESEFGWAPDSGHLFIVSEKDGWAHIYAVPAAGGEAVKVTEGAWEARPELLSFDLVSTPALPQWIGDYIYYESTEGGTNERQVYRIHPDGSGKQRLTTEAGVHAAAVSEDGAYVARQFADLDHPGDLWVGEHRVTNRVRPAFDDYPWPATRFVEFPSRWDGATVHAKLLLPPGYDPQARGGKQWPAVFFIHGSGYATSVLKQWGSYQEQRYVFNCYLANQGYVIMDLDYRGSTGYGRDWRSDVYLHMGGSDLGDVLGAVDYLGTLGNVDLSRLGIWGVSYGGFMTDMAMFLSPDTFQVGSAWASVTDWENYNAGYTAQRLNTPAENPEAYRRSSPITFSGKLKNHLLIVHGMVDNNVLFQDDVQLTEKLIHEGRDFGHIYYPEESHAFIRDETWIDAARRTAEWFDRYLKQ